ncbi:MAG: hypothetical protein ACYSRR_03545 [Planctomycetota bacterium]
MTPKSQKQPKIDTSELPSDLAEIVAVWRKLPENIRSAIMTLVRAGSASQTGNQESLVSETGAAVESPTGDSTKTAPEV